MNSTVYAPSSALGGAVAVIRVSGSLTVNICEKLLTKPVVDRPGRLLHCTVRESGEDIDDCMAVFFAGPHSYTGEDMLEIHCHGGYASVTAILAALSRTGALPAEGGEFTKRAYLNGKMDLSRAEAVMDLVSAHADGSRKAALCQLQGGLESKIHAAEEELLEALSALDAAIDYPDEMEEEASLRVPERLDAVRRLLYRWIQEGRRAKVLRNGMRITLCGKPNVGKSSLLNCLLGEERAIVTSLPGTTRDILDEETVFHGIPVRLIDTAGIREANDLSEQIGVERAKKALESADLLYLLLDGSLPLEKEDLDLLEMTKAMKRIVIRTKADLPPCRDAFGDISLSTVTGQGIEALKEKTLALAGPGDTDGTITNERHVFLLEKACSSVEDALNAEEPDCRATDIRDALCALGSISGRNADDAVIDRIFSRFCVGK